MIEDDIKSALSEGRIKFGARESEKLIKSGAAKTVVVSKNCKESFRKDLEHLGKVSGIKIETFSGSGNDLGIFCGKPFSVSALSIL